MWQRLILFLTVGAFSVVGCQSLSQPERPPFADIHLHYNWDQDEIYTPEQALDDLKKHNVVLAVVSSVPSDFALKLSRLGQDWIVPFYTPYYDAGNRLNWFYDEKVVDKARAALASGEFYGLGEIHLVAGAGPRRDNPVFLGLMELAREYDVPVNIHTDSSRYEYMLSICEQHADITFQWAHVGGILQPEAITPVMEACPNVWADMSARDPWHYGDFVVRGQPIPENWRQWILRFQDRIMVGTDPVSGGHEVYTWHEADDGWSQYGELYDYHRGWMNQLPPEVEKKIRLTNARRFFDYALQKIQ
ncbi:amidohydrolase family protein [Thiohalophilus sp.]|uniref:amidohydrolase family protein n=1 Tax=Thiohalophilus sp. TaxID=3028392 RepID=UPI003974CECE